MFFSQIIKKIRMRQKMTQAEFAKKLGFAKSRISNIECDMSRPSAPLLRKICNVFGISCAQVIGKEELEHIVSLEKKLSNGLVAGTEELANE